MEKQKSFPGQKEDEEILIALREHPVILIKSFFKAVPFLVLSLYLLVVFQNPIVILVSFFVLIAALSYLFYKWVIWQKGEVFITDLRVVNFLSGKLFLQSANETYFSQIGDVSYQIKGILATIFNFGAVKIISGSGEMDLINVKNPQKLKDQILEISRDAKNNQKIAETQALIDLIEKARK